MSDEIPEDALAEIARTGVWVSPDGQRMIGGFPLADVADDGEEIDLGELAYMGYVKKSGGVSLVSGEPLPAWADQDERVREAWRHGAFYVAAEVAAEESRLRAEVGRLRRGCGVHPDIPGYEHPECGFHWHGKDSTDVPLDGRREPLCPRCEAVKLSEALDFAEKQDDAWTTTVDEILRHSGERSNLTDEGRRQAAVGYVRNLEAACKAAGLSVEGPGL